VDGGGRREEEEGGGRRTREISYAMFVYLLVVGKSQLKGLKDLLLVGGGRGEVGRKREEGGRRRRTRENHTQCGR
jgi:hypothetical protein